LVPDALQNLIAIAKICRVQGLSQCIPGLTGSSTGIALLVFCAAGVGVIIILVVLLFDWRLRKKPAEIRHPANWADPDQPQTDQAQPAAEQTRVAPQSVSLSDELQALAKLKEDGILSEDEFQAAKKRLIGETS
jgi:hypothetical protein